MDAMTAQARRFYHHVHHGGSLKESDVAAMVRAMEGKDATITRLTAELAEAREKLGLAYETAARACEGVAYSGKYPPLDDIGELAALRCRDEIRALASEAETAALAEIVKKAVEDETYACAEVANCCYESGRRENTEHAILARLDQRKEPTP